MWNRRIVAQVSNLLYRRLPVGSPRNHRTARGLEIRDTADWESALRGSRPVSRSNGNRELSKHALRWLPVRLACRRLGIRMSRHLLVVDVASQTVAVLDHAPGFGFQPGLIGRYRCSTSRFGIGQVENSNRTPLGLHRIARKIGGGWPVGTVFRSRHAAGFTWRGHPWAPITSRILWLEGLEPGFNRGGKVDTFDRYIYIHGTGDEPTLGRPASRGCIHLAAADLLPLYDRLPVGTLVWIQERWG